MESQRLILFVVFSMSMFMLVEAWQRDRLADPAGSSLLMAFRRKDVRALNEAARAIRVEAGELGEGGVPRWNFHKYLIGKRGEIAGTFGSKVAPESAELKAAIEAALVG